MNKFTIVSTSNILLLSLTLFSVLLNYGCYHVFVTSFHCTTPGVMKRIPQQQKRFILPVFISSQQQRIRPSISNTNIQLSSVTHKISSYFLDKTSPPNIILDRRKWFMTSAIVIGVIQPSLNVPSCNAIELTSEDAVVQPPPQDSVDPLVSFGESLSKNSYTNSIVPVQPASVSSSSSSWPHNAAHPLPIPEQDITLLQQPPPTIDEVLQQSKMKKQINPTTHG